jgi:thiamine pyrophosphate-dependent acetolactate synthase large subunit-like protein
MPNASDLLIDNLIEWGVEVIFGIPGDGINSIIEALRIKQDRVRFIQTWRQWFFHAGREHRRKGNFGQRA